MHETRRIIIECRISYEVTNAASIVFRVAPAKTELQQVRNESTEILPGGTQWSWCNSDISGYRILRVSAGQGELELRHRAEVDVSREVETKKTPDELQNSDLPVAVLPFLNPSRYCESDLLTNFALREFGQIAPGHERVSTICKWINSNIDYVPGSTDASSSVRDVLLLRSGVCRDYAHLGIAFCRALGIPARYVAGYAANLNPPDFHGFFEAYLENRWYLFDATGMAPLDGLVRIAIGRDAAEAPFASIVGQTNLLALEVSAVFAGNSRAAEAGVAVSTA